MITHSRTLPIVLGVDMVALLVYNYAGMCVTGACFLLRLWFYRLKATVCLSGLGFGTCVDKATIELHPVWSLVAGTNEEWSQSKPQMSSKDSTKC